MFFIIVRDTEYINNYFDRDLEDASSKKLSPNCSCHTAVDRNNGNRLHDVIRLDCVSKLKTIKIPFLKISCPT